MARSVAANIISWNSNWISFSRKVWSCESSLIAQIWTNRALAKFCISYFMHWIPSFNYLSKTHVGINFCKASLKGIIILGCIYACKAGPSHPHVNCYMLAYPTSYNNFQNLQVGVHLFLWQNMIFVYHFVNLASNKSEILLQNPVFQP